MKVLVLQRKLSKPLYLTYVWIFEILLNLFPKEFNKCPILQQ